jgi:alpha/beta superfamily hydrolase
VCFGTKDLGVVLTHPYGPLGGEKNNNVVLSLARFFQTRGISTVRFNFRGVGRSTGRGSWRGEPERQDVLAACKHLLTGGDDGNSPVKRVILCGYSYGSAIASSCADELPEIVAFVVSFC